MRIGVILSFGQTILLDGPIKLLIIPIKVMRFFCFSLNLSFYSSLLYALSYDVAAGPFIFLL